jgi:ABC-2 type transport system ATP-binding protein
MINFNEVSKIFKSDLITKPFTALDNVSFTVPEGSMVGFLGANGAGKTTSLKIIMDFIRPSNGSVQFSETLGKNKLEVFRNIGFLPERPYFYPNLTGEDFLIFMGQLSDMKVTDIKEQITLWSPRFKIDHALKRELKTYSKGMLQRIGFLSTIIHHPKIIILDEPLSGLDPIGRKELKDVIVEVHKQGKTVFFSTHIVPDIEEICDRVIFLKEGKLTYDGSVSALMKQAKNQDYEISYSSNLEIDSALIKDKIKLPDNILKITVPSEHKDKLVQSIVQSQGIIHNLELIRPSLEDIFYHTGTRS